MKNRDNSAISKINDGAVLILWLGDSKQYRLARFVDIFAVKKKKRKQTFDSTSEYLQILPIP